MTVRSCNFCPLLSRERERGEEWERKNDEKRGRRKKRGKNWPGRYSNLTVSHACRYKARVGFSAGEQNMRIRSADEKAPGIISVHATGPRIFFPEESNFPTVPSSKVPSKDPIASCQPFLPRVNPFRAKRD